MNKSYSSSIFMHSMWHVSSTWSIGRSFGIVISTVKSSSSYLEIGFIFIPGYSKIKHLARQNKELEWQIEEIKQANRRLKLEHQMLRNDPIYLEKVAREKLGVVREGEIVYQVVPAQEWILDRKSVV